MFCAYVAAGVPRLSIQELSPFSIEAQLAPALLLSFSSVWLVFGDRVWLSPAASKRGSSKVLESIEAIIKAARSLWKQFSLLNRFFSMPLSHRYLCFAMNDAAALVSCWHFDFCNWPSATFSGAFRISSSSSPWFSNPDGGSLKC